MSRIAPILLVLVLASTPTATGRADTPPMTPWKFETVHLKNGAVLQGLVTEESPSQIRFQNVRRAAGRPTVIIHTTFKRSEIAKVERLPDADHKKLEEHIQAL